MKCTIYVEFKGLPQPSKRELRYTYVVSSKAGTCAESLDWTSIRNATMRYLCIESATKGNSHSTTVFSSMWLFASLFLLFLEYVKYDSLVLPQSGKTNMVIYNNLICAFVINNCCVVHSISSEYMLCRNLFQKASGNIVWGRSITRMWH